MPDSNIPKSSEKNISFISHIKTCAMGSPSKSEYDAEFNHLINNEAYVDKTAFIEDVFKLNSSRLLITAPRKFAKTSSLKMLQAFIEMPMGLNEKINDKEPIECRHNYELFTDKLIIKKQQQMDGLKCTREEFLRRHLGIHPVIYCDLKCKDYIGDFNDAVLFYTSVIHKIFKKFSWLVDNEKLTDDERMKCKLWCDPLKLKNISNKDVLYGLEFLSHLLYKHFNKKITLLIDDYDSLIISAMFCVREHDLLDIIHFSLSMLIRLIKNDHSIERVIITGITNLINNEKYKMNLQIFPFLGCHPFTSYFGLTNDEFQNLNKKFNLEKFQKYFYKTSDGTRTIYPFRSYFKQNIKNFYETSMTIQKLVEVYQVREIRCKLMSLLRADNVPFEYVHAFNIQQLLSLRNQLLFPDSPEWSTANIFLNFLMLQGFLTFVPLTKDSNSIGLANEVVHSLFKEKLNEFIYSRCHFDEKLLYKCGELLANLSSTFNNKHLNKICENIEYTLARAWLDRSSHVFDEILLQCVVFFSLLEYDFSYCIEINAEHQFNILAIDKRNTKLALLIEFKKYNEETNDDKVRHASTACAALKLILDKRFNEINKNDQFFKEHNENIILLGMSLNGKNGLSICCKKLGDDLSKVIHVPENGQCLNKNPTQF